jgi:membrane fusion protein (multidrug efflux system)
MFLLNTCPRKRTGLARAQLSLRSVAVALLTALVAACSEPPAPAPDSSDAQRPVEVTVTVLAPQTLQSSIGTFGVLEALEEVNVAAETSGTVTAVHVNEGDRVQSGQLLLELDPLKRELAVTQAEQQVQRAEAALKEARLKLQRRRNLAAKETISREVLDNAQLALDGASAAYQQAQASQQLAVRELQDTRIYSPTAGLVDVQAVEVGEAVQVGATLITLQAVQGLRVHTWVSEADIGRIRAGGPARVAVSGLAGLHYAATIEWVGVNADPATGNFPVKLILTNAAEVLRPGMTAKVELQGIAVPDALMLPESALVDRNRRRVVFVVEDGVARLREPLLAAGFSNRLQVVSGLEPGDAVVVAGQSRLLDGDAVVTRGVD